MTCGCQAIILVAKVFHFDHFSGTFASAGRPIIFVSKTKITDHFTGKPEKKRGRSFQPIIYGRSFKWQLQTGNRSFMEPIICPETHCSSGQQESQVAPGARTGAL